MFKAKNKAKHYGLVVKPPVPSWSTPAKYTPAMRFSVGDRVGVRLLADKHDKRKHTCKAIQYSVGIVEDILPPGCQPYRRLRRNFEFYKAAAKARKEKNHLLRHSIVIQRSHTKLYVVRFNDGRPVVCPAYKLRRVVVDFSTLFQNAVPEEMKSATQLEYITSWILKCIPDSAKVLGV